MGFLDLFKSEEEIKAEKRKKLEAIDSLYSENQKRFAELQKRFPKLVKPEHSTVLNKLNTALGGLRAKYYEYDAVTQADPKNQKPQQSPTPSGPQVTIGESFAPNQALSDKPNQVTTAPRIADVMNERQQDKGYSAIGGVDPVDDPGQYGKRGLKTVVESGANIVDLFGELAAPAVKLRQLSPQQEQFRQQVGALSGAINDFAKTIKASDPRGKYARAPENIAEAFDPTRIAQTIGEQGPQMAALMAATVANPYLGTALMFGVEGGETLKNLSEIEKRTGKKIENKLFYATAVGAFNAALEKTGFDAILGKTPGLRGKLMQFVASGAIEGGTESLQEINQMIAEAAGTGDFTITPDMIDRLKQSWYAGTILGYGGGGSTQVIETAVEKTQDYLAEKRLDEAFQKHNVSFVDAFVREATTPASRRQQQQQQPAGPEQLPAAPENTGLPEPKAQKTAQDRVKPEKPIVTPPMQEKSQPQQEGQQESKESKQPEPPKRSEKKKKTVRRAKNVQDYIRKSGIRIKSEHLEEYGYGKGTKENKTLIFRVGRKNGMGVDEAARAALADGIIPQPPEDYNLADWFMEKVKENAPTEEIRVENMEREYEQAMLDEYGDDPNEMADLEAYPEVIKKTLSSDRLFDFDLFEPGLNDVEMLDYAEMQLNRLQGEVLSGKALPSGERLPTAKELVKFVKRIKAQDPNLTTGLEAPFTPEVVSSIFEGVKKAATERTAKTPTSEALTQVSDNLKKGATELQGKAEREFVEEQAKEGKKPEKMTKTDRQRKLREKVERGEYKGDMFAAPEATGQQDMFSQQKPEKNTDIPEGFVRGSATQSQITKRVDDLADLGRLKTEEAERHGRYLKDSIVSAIGTAEQYYKEFTEEGDRESGDKANFMLELIEFIDGRSATFDENGEIQLGERKQTIDKPEKPEVTSSKKERTSGQRAVPRDTGGVDRGQPTETTPQVNQPEEAEQLPTQEKRSDAGTVQRGGGSTRQPSASGKPRNRKSVSSTPNNERNYRITDDLTRTGGFGAKTRFKENLAALKLLKQIESENREATAAEKAVLVKYVGFGGMPQAFATDYSGNVKDEAWAKEFKQLKELLTLEEYSAAARSTLNAHFTSPEVINAVYRAVEKLGFKSGRILEPSMGVGHFIGLLPTDMHNKSEITGVELDNLTGRIAQLIYPDADIRIQGFQNTFFLDNYFDLIISNVPFGDYKLKDSDKQAPYNKYNLSIHNFFFAKSLEKVRPGGMVAFITSRYTMDSTDSSFRKYIADKADLIGAIRLPNDAFLSNANTEVVTDIIFLRKKDGTAFKGEQFINTDEMVFKMDEGKTVYNQKTGRYENKITHYVNEYFVKNPAMVAGKHDKVGSMYGAYEYTVTSYSDKLENRIDKAIEQLPENVIAPPKTERVRDNREVLRNYDSKNVKEGGYAFVEGNVYRKENGELVKQRIGGENQARLKGILSVRDVARKLLVEQNRTADDAAIEPLQKELNKVYDAFVKKHGFLNERKNKEVFKKDPDYPFVKTLERGEGKDRVKADLFSKRVNFPDKRVDSAETSEDALNIVLNESGSVDIARMVELTGFEEEKIVNDLYDKIFLNPETGWETTEEYLSGDVKRKLKVAKELVGKDERLQKNIDSLETVQPEDVPFLDIHVDMGSSWIPENIYQQFVDELLGLKGGAQIEYIPKLASYVVKQLRSNIKNEQTFASGRLTAIDLIAKAMNHSRPTVTARDTDGKTYVDQDATAAAIEKQAEIVKEFRDWIWKDPERAKSLEAKYNEEMNRVIIPKFNGQHLTFPGQSTTLNGKPFSLMPHQKDAVFRIVRQRNVLLQHEVGTGKTFTMITAAMELKRLGLVKKPMFIIPNHLVKSRQFENEFLSIYPNANILAMQEGDLSKMNRKAFMGAIANNNWDAVIIPHQAFQKISLRDDVVRGFLQKDLDEYELLLRDFAEKNDKRDPSFKQLEKAKEKLEEQVKALITKGGKDEGLYFEDLGIDQLFVDEAHNFKNLGFPTKLNNVAGVGTTSAGKTKDLDYKIRYLYEKNKENKGVVFATATPISNALTEMYVMQHYLQPDKLGEYGVENFDAWVHNFGEVSTELEFAASGRGLKSRERLRYLNNLPELMKLWAQVADIFNVADAPYLQAKVPKLKGGKRITVKSPIDPETLAFWGELANRAEKLDPRDRKTDNMLKINGEGRRSSLDIRLVVDGASANPNSKAALVSDQAARIYKETAKDKLTQLIFIDNDTPKAGFNVYDDIRDRLVLQGVKREEVAFIHDFEKPEDKERLFSQVNSGKIRILMGSTKKMGEGTNVQKKLIALHHVDAPFRPSDIEQREGRIIRNGNTNPEVEIYQYVTTGKDETMGFDSYIWQILENKAKGITQTKTLDTQSRSLEEDSEVVLNTAETKAIATGNPLVVEKLKIDKELQTLQVLKRGHNRKIQDARVKYDYATIYKERAERSIESYKKDLQALQREYDLNIGGERFKGFGDKKHVKDYGKYVMDLIAKRISQSNSGGDIPIGRYGSFSINIRTRLDSNGQAVLDGLVFVNNEEYKLNLFGGDVRLLKQFELETLQAMVQAKIDNDEKVIKEQTGNLTELEKELLKKFERQPELDNLKKRQTEIEKELSPDPVMPEGDVAEQPETEEQQPKTDGGGSGPQYDLGGYDFTRISEIDLPELVELVQAVMNNRVPKIREIIARKADALGVLRGKRIELKAELFKDPQIAKIVLAHELGHWIDQLPDGYKHGNILGKIASIRNFTKQTLEEYPGADNNLTSKDRARLRREAQKMAKGVEVEETVTIDEGTEPITITPEDILGIWNDALAGEKNPELLRFVQAMSNEQKKEAIKAAMKGKVLEHFQGMTRTKQRTVTRKVFRDSPEDIKNLYKELLLEEIQRRRLFYIETVMEELKTLSDIWKPFGDPQYRYKPNELYADAFSVLINSPALLKMVAPTYYKAFFNWIDQKPQFARAYDDILTRIHDPENKGKRRDERIQQMFNNAKEQLNRIDDTSKRQKVQQLRDEMARRFVDQNHDIIKKVQAAKKAGRQIQAADNPQYWVEELPYTSSQVYAYLQDIDKLIIKEAERSGISLDELGKLMFLKRVATSREEGGRDDLANPLGFDAETALEQMGWMKDRTDPQQWEALTGLIQRFHDIRRDHVVSFMREGQMYSDELMDLVESSDHYATFDVFYHRLEREFGSGVSSHVHKQIGTLAEINNPFVATIMKDAAIIRAINRKLAAEKLENFLKEFGEFEPAEWDFRRKEFKKPKSPKQDIVMYLQKGKLKGFYVPKEMARSFQFNPYEFGMIYRVWSALTRPFKELFVGKNIPWTIFNVQRDIRGFLTRIPEATFLKFIPHLVKAAPEAYRDVFKNDATDFVKEMYRNKELLVGRAYQAKDANPTTELDDLLTSYGLEKAKHQNRVVKTFKNVFDALEKPGKFTERWIKIAGKRFLIGHTDLHPKEISHVVRSRVGSPDFYRRGTAYRFYNNLFLFSNAGKEGWRASIEAAKDSPASVAWKFAKYDILPKVLMYSAAVGLMGSWLRDWYEKIPEYDKTNYMVVPIDETEDGKVIYVVMPHDFTGQVVGGLLWKFLNLNNGVDVQQIVDYTAGGLPYQGLHPVLQAGSDVLTFAKGRNPVDSWRNEHIIGDKEFQARDHRAIQQLLAYEYNNLGGWVIKEYRYKDVKEAQSEIEKAMGIPFVGAFLRRFIRVSDRGLSQKLMAPIEKERVMKARNSLDVDERIQQHVKDIKNPATTTEAYKLFAKLRQDGLIEKSVTQSVGQQRSQFLRRYMSVAIRKNSNALQVALRQARNMEERQMILEAHFGREVPIPEVRATYKQILQGETE